MINTVHIYGYAQFAGGSGTEEDPYQVSTIEQLQAVRDYPSSHFIQVDDIDASETANWNDGKGFIPIGDNVVRFSGTYDGNVYKIYNLNIDRSDQNYVGLFGYMDNNGRIENVTLSNVNIFGNLRVGALLGYNSYGVIKNVIVNGKIEGSSEIGGVVGSNRGLIENTIVIAQIDGARIIGGVVGFNRQNIINAYTECDVSGSLDLIGGLVGYNYLSSANIDKSYANGTVSGMEEVGGLVGMNNLGNVSDSFSTSKVTGINSIGGLIGVNHSNSTLTNSFSSGVVTGEEDVGGFIGTNGGTIITGYWDTETSGQSNGVGSGIAEGVEGLITTEMTGKAAKDNMDNFDFDETWAALDDDYPHLDFQIEEINISLEQNVLKLSKTTQATVTVDLIDGTSTTATTTANYESSDENVATIDENGTVTSHDRGDATITASLATHTDEAVITVHAPMIIVQPELLHFEEVKIGDSHQKTITLKNDGDLDLEGSVGILEESEYFTLITGDGSYSLAPDESLEIKVQFEPLSFGSFEDTVEVSHNAGNEDDPFYINLTGIGATPATPILAYPEDEAEGIPTDIDLAWNTAPHTDTYSVQLSTDPNFEHIVIDSTGIADTTIATPALEHSTTYYWRVRGTNAGGYGEWSEAWNFTTIVEEPEVVILDEPKHQATNISTTPSFTWYQSLRAEEYRIELATDNEFTTAIVDSVVMDTSFAVESSLENETDYYWRVKAVNESGESNWSDVWQFTTVDVTSVYEELGVPNEYKLLQNYPNPFNPSTVIRYGIPERSHVKLSVFNSLGQRVAILVNEEQEAQYYETVFNATSLPSGVYIYRFQAGDFVKTKKLLFLK